ncbi:MAG: hypothetical protein HY532_07765 [Chloroflexi bacterium]|nr:hypothetical protein [Chloroflexota bacterium]
MTWFIAILLGTLALLVAALPFLWKRSVPQAAPDPMPDPVEELQARRQAIYHEVQLLHNDWSIGQVTEAEYRERLQGYRLQAAALLREEIRLRELEERLEEEVLAVRAEGKALSEAETVACPNCSRLLEVGMAQCPACGAVVTEAAPHG